MTKRFLRNNGLSIVMFGIFFVAIVGMSFAGWQSDNRERQDHHQPVQGYGEYVTGGGFIEAVFENWESEFLQMWALVMLTVFLYQKGSADSKPLRGKAAQDTRSRYVIIKAQDWRRRRRAAAHWLYAHSLGLALLVIFIVSFLLHAVGGVDAHNESVRLHGGQTLGLGEYMTSSKFWFESLQNWQSEFLAVGVLMVLSIYLRERGSTESKPVGKKFDHKTSE